MGFGWPSSWRRRAVMPAKSRQTSSPRATSFDSSETAVEIVDATDELQKKFIAAQERKEVTTEAIGIDNFLVPSYLYTPVDKVSAKLVNTDSKTNSADFLMVLRAIVETKQPGAIEKRLVASVFNADVTGELLLNACGGLVELKKEPDWSVKKA